MKAMILAAGLGTRLKPFTNTHPKALALVNGKPVLQRNIEYLAQFGIKDIIVNVHHFADQVKDALQKNNGYGSRVTVSDESDEILETGGGVKKASGFFTGESSFVVMNVDILTDMDIRLMIRQHKSMNSLATLAVTNRITNRYFLFDELGNLCGWKNEKTNEQKICKESDKYTQKAFSGISVISPAIYPMIKFK